MENASILSAFDRMWQHVVVALGNKLDSDKIVVGVSNIDGAYVLNTTNGNKTIITADNFTFADGVLTLTLS